MPSSARADPPQAARPGPRRERPAARTLGDRSIPELVPRRTRHRVTGRDEMPRLPSDGANSGSGHDRPTEAVASYLDEEGVPRDRVLTEGDLCGRWSTRSKPRTSGSCIESASSSPKTARRQTGCHRYSAIASRAIASGRNRAWAGLRAGRGPDAPPAGKACFLL
jgi:hypothetical protein